MNQILSAFGLLALVLSFTPAANAAACDAKSAKELHALLAQRSPLRISWICQNCEMTMAGRTTINVQPGARRATVQPLGKDGTSVALSFPNSKTFTFNNQGPVRIEVDPRTCRLRGVQMFKGKLKLNITG